MSYDNKHFVSTDFTPRKEFMRRWISLPGGASYVAIDDHKNVIGNSVYWAQFMYRNTVKVTLFVKTEEITSNYRQIWCPD